jgi:hypothetical protein
MNGLEEKVVNNDEQWENRQTMLPGLSTTINSLSMSWWRILTDREVTGGSCRWTTFLWNGFNDVAEDTLKHTLSDRHCESLYPASQSCH